MKAKEFIPVNKPRNFVAKNAQSSGAGRHQDSSKKKDQEQGKVKHKKDLVPMESAPDGWEGTVKAMKKHKDIDNPYALAWSMKNKGYKSHKKEGVAERVRDPEDWDEGNTEPPNNFAVYINGKKWKIFKGRGQYADDAREQAHYEQLKGWARKKSAATGKQWSVSITGEPATE